jgi:hypothetical protein
MLHPLSSYQMRSLPYRTPVVAEVNRTGGQRFLPTLPTFPVFLGLYMGLHMWLGISFPSVFPSH